MAHMFLNKTLTLRPTVIPLTRVCFSLIEFHESFCRLVVEQSCKLQSEVFLVENESPNTSTDPR